MSHPGEIGWKDPIESRGGPFFPKTEFQCKRDSVRLLMALSTIERNMGAHRGETLSWCVRVPPVRTMRHSIEATPSP